MKRQASANLPSNSPPNPADQPLVDQPEQPESGQPEQHSPTPTAQAVVPRAPAKNGIHVHQSQPLAECPTSLNPDDPRQRALLFAAGNPGDYSFDNSGSVVIRAHHWLVYPDEREDAETGEIRQFATVVLFDRDGKFFKTTSQYATRRISAAISLFRPADWVVGVPFIIRQRRSKTGRTYHDIRVLVDDELAPVGE